MSIKFMYFRKPGSQKQGVTVAYNTAETVNGQFHVFYAVAVCSRKDRFCKHIGRKVASGRFVTEGLNNVITFSQTPEFSTIRRAIAGDIQARASDMVRGKTLRRMQQDIAATV